MSTSCCSQVDDHTKRMECKLDDTNKCAVCVKLPCKGGSVQCEEEVKIFCVKPEELQKCCKETAAAHNNECCVCVLCEKDKPMQAVVECCGTQKKMSAESGKSICISVPKIDGASKGCGEVQMQKCDAQQLDACCNANTAKGQCCCCVCLSCNEQKCVVTVRCA